MASEDHSNLARITLRLLIHLQTTGTYVTYSWLYPGMARTVIVALSLTKTAVVGISIFKRAFVLPSYAEPSLTRAPHYWHLHEATVAEGFLLFLCCQRELLALRRTQRNMIGASRFGSIAT